MQPLTIGQVAKQAGVGVETIRFIRRAKELGFTMRPTRRVLTMITAAVLASGILGVAEPALAAIDHYEVQVDGLACPFCAYGLEKKLKKLPGAKNVQIELNAGRASFDVGDDVLFPGPVKNAVRDAGFTARDITVTASGTVEGEGDQLRLDVGGEQTLVLRGGEAFGDLQGLVKKEHRDVVVTGLIRRVDDTWQLTVAEAKPQ